MVGFDLPVRTSDERKLANRFRHNLQNLGFERVQYSFYGFHARTRERLATIEKVVERLIPPGHGWVLIFEMTDRQFVDIRHYRGGEKPEKAPVEPPKQLVLF